MELKIENINKTYINKEKVNHVLKNISIEINKGEFVTLLGPSGCGKTTLLSIIAGFNKPDSGKIFVEGKEESKPGISRGFVFQNYALFPWLTIRKNIEFPLKEARLSKDAIRTRADELLNLAGLKSHENQYPHEISGGMKQRTALIRALANKPKVLLMDEPLGALDMRMRQNLQSEIQSIWMKEKTTVIMVTHDVDEAVYMSDRIILMTTNNGKIEMDIRVNLARPRNRDGQEYMKIVRLLTNKLNEDL